MATGLVTGLGSAILAASLYATPALAQQWGGGMLEHPGWGHQGWEGRHPSEAFEGRFDRRGFGDRREDFGDRDVDRRGNFDGRGGFGFREFGYTPYAWGAPGGYDEGGFYGATVPPYGAPEPGWGAGGPVATEYHTQTVIREVPVPEYHTRTIVREVPYPVYLRQHTRHAYHKKFCNCGARPAPQSS
jgi:hypothetical protein